MSFIFEESARIENIQTDFVLNGAIKLARKNWSHTGHSVKPMPTNLQSITDVIRGFKRRQQGNCFAIVGTQPGEGSTTLVIQLANLLTGRSLDTDRSIPRPALTENGRSIGLGQSEIGQFFTADFQQIFTSGMLQKMRQNFQDNRKDPIPTAWSASTRSLDGWGADLPTLLIDANWLQPGLDGKLRIPRQPGLLELINGAAEWRQVLYPIPETPIWVLPTGDLTNKGYQRGNIQVFRQLVDRIRAHFNYIFIDCCPLDQSKTGLALASAVDGVIMVLRAGHSRWEMAKDTKQQLASARANILGVIMNTVATIRK